MTALRLVDLLRYKTELPITIKGKKKASKWIRIIGDSDLQESYKLGRIASGAMRRKLKNAETIEYQDSIQPIDDAEIEECIESIIISMTRQIESEADANIERPDLPDLEEFAIDSDAPTLEEQEKLDEAIVRVETDYVKAKQDYVTERIDVLRAELKGLSDEEVRKRTKEEQINTIALTTFLLEVQAEKAWRSVYTDKSCSEREFNNRQEYTDLSDIIKNQILAAYSELEVNGDDIKN